MKSGDAEEAVVGFVGLGNMGQELASNLVNAGRRLIVFDAAGTAERAPDGAACAATVEEVAAADVVVLSLPDGDASRSVTEALVAAADCRTTFIIDTSTIGMAIARELYGRLRSKGITYVDAPVSGGVAGARSRTIAVMFAGPDEAFAQLKPVLDGLTDRYYHVGLEPGLGQAMKIANNFLSATALAATSEAVAFGVAAGLDSLCMLEVLNASSGQSSATSDKFPNQILTERFASGFTNTLMCKDLELYRTAANELGTAFDVGAVTTALWERFAMRSPKADFTRIYPFVAEAGRASG